MKAYLNKNLNSLVLFALGATLLAWTALVFINVKTELYLATVAVSNSPCLEDSCRPKGALQMTPEMIAEMKANHKEITKVNLTQIGLDRINEVRTAKGLSKLKTKPAKIGVNDIEGQINLTQAVNPNTGGTLTASVDPNYVQTPSYVDNSKLKYFPPIGNQGSLGSCAAFSTTYYLMTYENALAKDLDVRSTGNVNILSPKWTYNMNNWGANGGIYVADSLRTGTINGIPTWSEFPYDSNYLQWSTNPDVWRSALGRQFNAYTYVSDTTTDAGREQLKQLLLNGHILVYETGIDSWLYKNIGNLASTTLDDAFAGKPVAYYANGRVGGHAMTLVGYNDNLWVDINSNGQVDSGEMGAFRIANSWGSSWRDGGFAWVAYDALKSVSAVSGWAPTNKINIFGWYGKTAYSITAKENYTPRYVARFTANTVKRDQMSVKVAVSPTSQSVPKTYADNQALTQDGGAYSFIGTTAGVDGTFYLDMTGLIPANDAVSNYYLQVYDVAAGSPLTFKSADLIDFSRGVYIPFSTTTLTFDGTQTNFKVKYPAPGTPIIITTPDCTTINYSAWSVCTASSTQIRTIVSTVPAVCNVVNPVLTQSCTYTVPTCSSFTYSPWTTCLNSSQTRTITSSAPTGCTGGTPEPLIQSCVVSASTVTAKINAGADTGAVAWNALFSAGNSTTTSGRLVACEWSWGDGTANTQDTACGQMRHTYNAAGTFAINLRVTDSNGTVGTATKTVTATGSVATTTPVVNTCSSFTYSAWSVCTASSTQTRTVIASSPAGCTGGTPVLTQSCTYTAPACTTINYSAWGTCSASGVQTRTITSSSPTGCDISGATLSQSCTYVAPTPVTSIVTAKINAGASTGVIPWTALFSAGNSTTTNGRLTTCNWSWGDGTPDISDPACWQIKHTYTTAGSYTVKLIVTDSNGQTGSVTKSVIATAPVTAASFFLASLVETTRESMVTVIGIILLTLILIGLIWSRVRKVKLPPTIPPVNNGL